MKKLVYVTIALVALFAANSCKNKNNVPVISAADSVEVEDAMNDSTIYGVCGEGTSMHSLELISDDGDTLSVFIDDENPDVVQGGLLAGDRIALIGYPWTSWKILNGKLLLNKDTFAIDKLGSDSLMLENTQGIFVFKRQE